jgi:hypothetical protein
MQFMSVGLQVPVKNPVRRHRCWYDLGMMFCEQGQTLVLTAHAGNCSKTAAEPED